MSLPKVIAICGFKRSGKDTVADYVSKAYQYEKRKIADPLKKVCEYLFDLSYEQTDGNGKEVVDERWGVTPRQIMQFFGTEVMQYRMADLIPSMDRKFWIKRFVNDSAEYCVSKRIVVSDLRFLHEFSHVKEAFGAKTVVFRIINNRVEQNDQHESEKEWLSIPADYVINNDGCLEELHSKIDAIMKSLTMEVPKNGGN